MSQGCPRNGCQACDASAATGGVCKGVLFEDQPARREELNFIANTLFLRSSVTDIAREGFNKYIRE
jgi:hypothetical protein